MKRHNKQFLGLDPEWTGPQNARVVILPFPYAGGISCGEGTDQAPDQVLEASQFLELYDEVLHSEPYRTGICTLAPPEIPGNPEKMIQTIQKAVKPILKRKQFPIVIGGDHSISSGFYSALLEQHKSCSVIQFDAHADLRDTYENSKLSHACVMSRIREHTNDTLQLGIRSLSKSESDLVQIKNICLGTLYAIRFQNYDWRSRVLRLPDPVFITFDVDVLDWSIVRSTGTPEPGGLLWDETLEMLQFIFTHKQVVGLDVVELSANPDDFNSPFAVAKLIYKMIGFLTRS